MRALAVLMLLTVLVPAFEFGPYPDGSVMTVALTGGIGDSARITVIPAGADPHFLRYQGYINQTALAPSSSFTISKNTTQYIVLSRPGWGLNVSLLRPTVSLIVGGVVVSRDLEPPTSLQGSACDPPGWQGLAPGVATTVASTGSCLRGMRTLSSSENGSSTGIIQEHIFGFGQTVTPGLNAVGATKFIATFSRTLDTGPSHAPSPSYISLGLDPLTNTSLSHGYFLNTHGFSAFDVGKSNKSMILVSSPDPILDYFLFSGPTPSAVIGQQSEVVGGHLSLPPKWAMGMKYDPAEAGYNTSFINKIVQQFADRRVRPDRVVLEPAWQGTKQYNWDKTRFPDAAQLIANITPTKLILWEHPILDTSGDFYTSLVSADCLAKGHNTTLMPKAKQFSDLTLERCQELWKSYQLNHAIASGAVGFKLDEDDVDKDVGFTDATEFPSGFKGHQFHNIQGYIWQRIFHEMFSSIGLRTWLQSRGGYAGSQAYPTNSYSDGYDYKTYVLGVVNSGFSGLIWAPEMRHATCGPNHSDQDHADFARRVQLMFLSPQAQYNAWDSKDGTTLWPDGGPGAANCSAEWMVMFKEHYDLRTGLASYLFSAFEAQSHTGVPVTRALVVDSPEDIETWGIDSQYLIGDALMFPPAGMSDPQSQSRQAYFPKTANSWHSWYNASVVYSPGTWATIPTPIMTAPLFVKGGVPIFYQEPDAARDTLGIRVWLPKTPNVCKLPVALQWSELYDDDGETTEYRTHGLHWRGHAGFVRCSDGRLLLQFQVSHSSYTTMPNRVTWRIQGVTNGPSQVGCPGSSVEWSHVSKQSELHLTVGSIQNHGCIIQM